LSGFASFYPALRHRNFRRLWVVTFCSTGGQWIQQATLGWVVYDVTGSGALLGAVLSMRAIPMLLLAPVSGVVADRFDRKQVLAVSQLLVVTISFALAAALALERVQVWHLFAFTLLAGVGVVFDRTMRNTLLFSVVPRADVANAVALNSVAFSVTRTLGPAVAGFLIAWVGPALNFMLQGLLYLAVVAIVVVINTPYEQARRARHGTLAAEMQAGLRFAVTDPVARIMLLLGLANAFLLIPSCSALMPVFAVKVFATGPAGLGLLLSAVGAGGVIGGVVAAWCQRFDRAGLMQTFALLTFSAALVGFALSPNAVVAAVFLVVAGGAEMVHLTSNHTALQMCAPPELRGRVASLLPMFPAFIALGSLVSGIGADLIGAPATVIVTALVAAGVAIAVWSRSRALRTLRLSALVAGH
jgi:predicted MFS family arabinose efflux permease